MKRPFAALLLLSTLLPVAAAEKEKGNPNTLTSQEVAVGWILLFDGETQFGLGIDGQAEVKDGCLVLGGEKKTVLSLGLGLFELHWDYRWEGKEAPRRSFSSSDGAGYQGSMRQTTEKQGSLWRTDRFTAELGTDPLYTGFRGTMGNTIPSPDRIEYPADRVCPSDQQDPGQCHSARADETLASEHQVPAASSEISLQREGFDRLERNPRQEVEVHRYREGGIERQGRSR